MSDWGGLGAIITEARKLDDAEKARAIVDCPQCGTPLDVNVRGEGNCPMGHYRTPSIASAGGER